jgi:hypothetical protein
MRAAATFVVAQHIPTTKQTNKPVSRSHSSPSRTQSPRAPHGAQARPSPVRPRRPRRSCVAKRQALLEDVPAHLRPPPARAPLVINPATSAPGLALTAAESAPGTTFIRICAGTGLTPSTSAPGLDSLLAAAHPHWRRDWALCSSCRRRMTPMTSTSRHTTSRPSEPSRRPSVCASAPAASSRCRSSHTSRGVRRSLAWVRAGPAVGEPTL